MSPEQTAIMQTLGSCGSVAAAIVAIIVAMVVERNAGKRFDAQLNREAEIAVMNVKPLLDVHIYKYMDSKLVLISNDGIGIAIITSISFSKGGEDSDELKDLIGLPDHVYDHYYAFRKRKCYIKPDQPLILAKLTKGSLEERHFPPEEIEFYLESWQKRIDKINIKIAYTDILGNQQDSYEITL